MGEIMQEHEDIERLHSYSRFSCHFLTLFAAQMQTLKKKKKRQTRSIIILIRNTHIEMNEKIVT